MFLDPEEEAFHYEQYEYENRVHEVKCKSCGWFDEGPQMDLELKGWSLGQKGEFCPKCAFALLQLLEAISHEERLSIPQTRAAGNSVSDDLPF